MKAIAVRLDEEVHEQLRVIAQLSAVSITELIRVAVVEFLDAKKSDPALASHADSVLAEIDADAAARREAIASLFASGSKPSRNKAK